MSSRVAILSDVIMKYGGAERVLDSFLEIYPQADVYTLFVVPDARERICKKYPNVRIKTSVWQWLIRGNSVSKYIAVIKLWSWIYWERLDLRDYDIVLSSSHSFMSKNAKVRAGAFHLSYIHTPPRYLYGVFNEIEMINHWPVSWVFGPAKWFLKYIDRQGASRPNMLVANSKNVASRIMSFYGREAVVVYPPVDVPILNDKRGGGEYYVWVSRLVRQKGAELAIGACQKIGRKLVIVGGGGERDRLEKISGPNITFLGACSDVEKYWVMGRARCLIYTSMDEDFGIVPVEALKLGIPVLAYNSGGVREVVGDGITGVFYDEYSVDGLIEGIKRFEKLKISKIECKKRGRAFGKRMFEDKIRELIDKGNGGKNK